MDAVKSKKKRKHDSSAFEGGAAQHASKKLKADVSNGIPSQQQHINSSNDKKRSISQAKHAKQAGPVSSQSSERTTPKSGSLKSPTAQAQQQKASAGSAQGKELGAGKDGKRAGNSKLSMHAMPDHSEVKHSNGQRSKTEEHTSWPFPTDYLDHFETSKQALLDLEPALYRLANHLGKPKSDLVVYDPYFCKGAIREHYQEIGIKKLVHENRDFYADVDSGQVPDYDILVTNPPYSGDHKERIIKFCMESGKPWALLMPNYVANKQYFQDEALELVRRLGGSQAACAPFFLVPSVKYDYEHPEGTGHGSSPFFSIWFLHLAGNTSRVLTWWEKQVERSSKKNVAEAQQPLMKVLRTVSDLQDNCVVPSWKRPNPRQRRKLKQSKG